MEANAGQGNGNGGEVTGKSQKNKRWLWEEGGEVAEGHGMRESGDRKKRKINVPRSAIPCRLCFAPILASLQRISELFVRSPRPPSVILLGLIGLHCARIPSSRRDVRAR